MQPVAPRSNIHFSLDHGIDSIDDKLEAAQHLTPHVGPAAHPVNWENKPQLTAGLLHRENTNFGSESTVPDT